MSQWKWVTGDWICACGYDENHPLANYCGKCGREMEGKAADSMPDIPWHMGDPVVMESIPLDSDSLQQVDGLFSVFGQLLLVDCIQGKMSTWMGTEMEPLPLVGRELRQVDFDRWRIYALAEDGTLLTLPVDSLVNRNMLGGGWNGDLLIP